MVLLKNDGPTLPFDPSKKTVVIGPLGQSLMDTPAVQAPGHDMLGPWWGVGRDQDAVSPFARVQAPSPTATHTAGCTPTHTELYDPAGECPAVDTAAVKAAAMSADKVVLALGE